MLNETVHNYAAVAPGTLHCFQCFSLALVPHGPTNFPKPSQAVPNGPKIPGTLCGGARSIPILLGNASGRSGDLNMILYSTRTWHKYSIGNMWTKICEKPGKKTSSKKREEHRRTIYIYEWVSEATAPSTLRLALVVTRPCRSVAQVGLHSKMPSRKSPRHGAHGLGGLGWWLQMLCSKQPSSNRFTQPLLRHYIPIFRWDSKQQTVSQCISEIALTTCSQMVERVVLHWCVLIFSLFFLYFLQLMS